MVVQIYNSSPCEAVRFEVQGQPEVQTVPQKKELPTVLHNLGQQSKSWAQRTYILS